MNVIFTVVASLAFGSLVKKRTVAVLAYVIADSFVFSFQTLNVLLNWMHGAGGIGGEKALGDFPTRFPVPYETGEVYAYGLVNLVIVLIGIGLTLGAHRLVASRAARKNAVSVG